MTRLLLIAAIAASALTTTTAATARADCRGVAGNLLAASNCGFDTDVRDWKGVPDATLAHSPATAGDPASAALRVTSSNRGSVTVSSACVPIKGTTTYQFSARLRLERGSTYFCGLSTFQFSDATCSTGQEPLAAEGLPPSAKWEAIEGAAPTRASAKSARLDANCSGPGAFTVLFDDFVIAPARPK